MDMATHPNTGTGRDVSITLRAHHAQRDLIDYAASISGTNRTDFMLESACRRAEDVLLDRRVFALDDMGWSDFMRTLDDPEPNAGLSDLMSTKAPWDQ